MTRSKIEMTLRNALQSALVLGISAAMVLPVYAKSTPEATSNVAQAANAQATNHTAEQIRKKLMNLSTYGVFDYLTFDINNNDVTLNGYASRPILKTDAERAVKSVEGVETVTNKIEVLPLSDFDDGIRLRTYMAIYRNPQLPRYSTGGPMMMPAYGYSGFGYRGFGDPMRSSMWMPGGITQNPPIGWTPVHIIVNNGNVTLVGFVGTAMDKQLMGMAVNRIPGVFGVSNDLAVVKS